MRCLYKLAFFLFLAILQCSALAYPHANHDNEDGHYQHLPRMPNRSLAKRTDDVTDLVESGEAQAG